MMKGKKGFTLIEMLVTITIIAILAAIAVPSALYFIDKAEKQKEETMFDKTVSDINIAITDLNRRGVNVNINSILNVVYQSYGGSYSSESNYVVGEIPYIVLPQQHRSGKCIAVELIIMKDGDTNMGCGYIVRFYEKADTHNPATEVINKRKKKKQEMIKIKLVPGLMLTKEGNGATIVDPNGVPIAPSAS